MNGYDDRETLFPIDPQKIRRGTLRMKLEQITKELDLCVKSYLKLTDTSLEDLGEIEQALWKVADRVKNLELSVFGDMRKLEEEKTLRSLAIKAKSASGLSSKEAYESLVEIDEEERG